MLSRRINCLPVVGNDGKVCGIITSTDLLRSYQKIRAMLKMIRAAQARVLFDFEDGLVFRWISLKEVSV